MSDRVQLIERAFAVAEIRGSLNCGLDKTARGTDGVCERSMLCELTRDCACERASGAMSGTRRNARIFEFVDTFLTNQNIAHRRPWRMAALDKHGFRTHPAQGICRAQHVVAASQSGARQALRLGNIRC